MRPLPLFLILAVSASAQTRIGVVETPGANNGNPGGSLSSSLGGDSAPQLVTLSLSAPSLAATAGLSLAPVPAALMPAPAVAAAGYAAVPALPAPVPGLLPAESAFAPTTRLKPLVVIKPSEERADGTKEDGETTASLSLPDLIDATKRLFGESSHGRQSADYLKPGAPFDFGTAETFRYRTALGAYGSKSAAKTISTLVDAAAGLARSAGIKAEVVERTGLDGSAAPALRIVPLKDGHRLNRLAWDLQKNFESVVEYAPHRIYGGVAAYNSTDKAMFLPDFGRDDSYEAILHESRHAAFAKRLRKGDLSVFHGALLAYKNRVIAPGAESYENYMSLEELSTHVKTVLHALLRAQRAGDAPARDAAIHNATKYAFQLLDVLRSAEINLFQLQRKLASGELASYRIEGPSWPAIPGGHWEAVNLPHAILVLPVLDEAPAPPRGLLDRIFKAKPKTAFEKAAQRHIEILRPLISALGGEAKDVLRAFRGETQDLAAARKSASRMTALAAKADEAFATAP